MANDLAMCPPVAEHALRVVSLTDGVPLMTAIANDFGYVHIFRRQLEIQYRAGDLLVVISASGNSPNLLEAVGWVKSRGGAVIGLLGFDGGRLASLCDASVIARTARGDYGPVEDVHMVLDHLIMTWFSKDRFGKAV